MVLKKYGEEYIKAVSVMIARGDFNRRFYAKEGLTIKDLDTYLEYIDLDKYIDINSVELDMLLGKVKNTKSVGYYDMPNEVSEIKITGMDLLLYSAVDDPVIFEKLLKCEHCDFSKISYSLSGAMQRNHLQISELLIKKGANLNAIYAGTKATIAEFQLIDILASLVFSRKINTKDISDRLQFILKYREKLVLNSCSVLEGILKSNVDYIKQVYVSGLELRNDDLLSRIEEFVSAVSKLRDSGCYRLY